MTTFDKLKVGDRVKTKSSGMATVLQVGCYKGTMVKLKCDKPRWACPFFYKDELEECYNETYEKNEEGN